MARTVRDASLDSRAARTRLKARGKPYYRVLEPGLHLGYRRLSSGAGKWVARHYVGGQTYQVETIGTADDYSDADGIAILSFRDAQTKARERMVSRAHMAAGKTGPVTVAAVMDEYLEFLDGNRKSGGDARYRDAAFIRPVFGKIEAAALTAQKIRHWHAGLAKEAARLRTKKGKTQKFRELGKDDETKRRRRASANRTLTVLKAALNRAWREGDVASDAEWRRVEPFENVDAARVRYLTIAEAKRLLNASDPDFRMLVQAALETGARYGELSQLSVADFNSDAGTVGVRVSKTGKPRHVVLTDEGILFFRQLCAGRAGDEIMLRNRARGTRAMERSREKLRKQGKAVEDARVEDDGRWHKSEQSRPMSDACKRAGIKPRMGFHGLRHTWASLAVMNGVPLLVIANNLGHTDTRMVEKHYGHLAPSYIADAIRAGAPKFGFKPDRKVRQLRAVP